MDVFTPRELMIVAAARELRDGEIVFVGMRLPLLGFLLAKHTHAPRALGLYENGLIRETPAVELLYTMSDLPNIAGATACGEMLMVMGLLAQGRVDVGFIGGAEIDRFGNVNTTLVRHDGDKVLRLPGSGGAGDIASLARRFIVLMPHERRRFPARVSYITSPGHGEGKGWRQRVGLPSGGPAAVITDKAILRPDPETQELRLVSLHPGVSLEEVRVSTGWELQIADPVEQTPPPTLQELRILRTLDPERVWTR